MLFTAHAASFGGQDTAPSRSEKPPAAATPPKVPFYKRRNFIICQIVTAIIGIVMIFVLLWPVVRAIAQHTLDVAEMHIESSVIQSPSNESFTVCSLKCPLFQNLILRVAYNERLRIKHGSHSRCNSLVRSSASK